MQVIWSPAALRQVARIYDYLVELNPSAAKQVIDELIAAGDSLANFPHRGRLVPNTELRELVSTYPYIIRYRVARDAVRIYACAIHRSGQQRLEDLAPIPHGYGHTSTTLLAWRTRVNGVTCGVF